MLRAGGLRVAVGAMVVLMVTVAFPCSASASGTRAAVQCTRSAPAAGERETLFAKGFRPHEMVTVMLVPGDLTVGSTTAAGQGAARLTFTVPGGLSGPYRARLTGGASYVTASCSLRLSGQPGQQAPTAVPMSGTEMALFGLGAIAVLLAVGGGLLVVVGRRTAATEPSPAITR